jgi:hypothetical protein
MPLDLYNGCPYVGAPYGEDGCGGNESAGWNVRATAALSTSIVETLTGPVHLNTTVTESAVIATTLSNVVMWPLSTALASGSAINYDLVWGTVAEVSADTTAALVKAMRWLATESPQLTSDVRWVAKLVTTESVVLSGAISGPLKRLLPIVAYVTANSSLSASHSFITAVAASIVANSLTTLTKGLDIEDSLDLDDAVVFLVKLVTTVLSSLVISDTLSQGLVILLPIEAELDVVSAIASQHTFSDSLTDSVNFVGALQLEDGEFSVWCKLGFDLSDGVRKLPIQLFRLL